MPRSPGFYFASIIFFIGVLILAVGASRVIAQTLDFMTFAELISGVLLIIAGYRGISKLQR